MVCRSNIRVGHHFDQKAKGALVCDACRHFFKKSVYAELDCRNGNNNCDLDRTSEKFKKSNLPPCQKCRLAKCLLVGMKKAGTKL